jgi:hypothetical protein
VPTGDDGAASINRAARDALARKLDAPVGTDAFKALGKQKAYTAAEFHRLAGILQQVEHLPGPDGERDGCHLTSTREYIVGSIPGRYECDVCMDEDGFRACSRCSAVKYCSAKCQNKAWKEHMIKCYECSL